MLLAIDVLEPDVNAFNIEVRRDIRIGSCAFAVAQNRRRNREVRYGAS